MSAQYFADLYDWLTEAYDAAMMQGQSQLAMQYVLQMRALEQAGLVDPVDSGETVH